MQGSVRNASTDDLEALLDIEAASYPEPWTADVFRGRLADPQSITLVSEQDGLIAGYATATVALQHSQLLSIAVHPTQRRHRLARLLLVELAGRCLDAGAVQMRLEVRASNLAARRLYESLTFGLVGLRPRYYGDEDAAIMAASLAAIRGAAQ
jgi:ribosomal-protein-alanine N-acetyltransferase